MRLTRYDPALETQQPDMTAMRRKTYISGRYFLLKLGHALFATFLKFIGKKDSDRYWDYSREASVNVHHVLYNCITGRLSVRCYTERAKQAVSAFLLFFGTY